MDTIQVKLLFGNRTDEQTISERINFIERMESPYGYTYCDLSENPRESKKLLIKISYPRYFYGNNAYLIKTKEECFEVQEHFVEILRRKSLFRDLDKIQITRVDIPFTYIMDKRERFSDYSNLFRILGEVYLSKRKRRSKAYIDLITEKKETILFADSKTSSESNSRVMIYDQYLNLKRKLTEEEFKRANEDFEDLPYRMRIEVSKRIRKNSFEFDDFKYEDLFSHYLPSYQKYLKENLFDFEEIDIIYDKKIGELSDKIEEYRKDRVEKNKRLIRYESFILKNMKDIYDYEIIRGVLKETIENDDTRKNAITTVRKLLREYEEKNYIIIFDVYRKLKEINKCIIKRRR